MIIINLMYNNKINDNNKFLLLKKGWALPNLGQNNEIFIGLGSLRQRPLLPGKSPGIPQTIYWKILLKLV